MVTFVSQEDDFEKAACFARKYVAMTGGNYMPLREGVTVVTRSEEARETVGDSFARVRDRSAGTRRMVRVPGDESGAG